MNAQRSASHLGTAAGFGAGQLPGWDAQGPRRAWVLGGNEMGTCHPQTRHFGRQQRPHTPCAINKYVSLDVCCYVPIPEWLGPLGSEQLLSAGKRKGSKWCGNAWQIGMQYTAGLSLLRDPQPGQGGGGE